MGATHSTKAEVLPRLEWRESYARKREAFHTQYTAMRGR